MITISIDVLLLDKARFKKVTKRNGQAAQYADLILVPTPHSDYGDYIVKQSVTKEERESGKDLPILGNGKNIEKGGAARRAAAPSDPQPPVENDSIPF